MPPLLQYVRLTNNSSDFDKVVYLAMAECDLWSHGKYVEGSHTTKCSGHSNIYHYALNRMRVPLTTDGWKTLRLNELFDIKIGNGFDYSKMTDLDPIVYFVSRIGYDNVVDWKVDMVDNVEPFEPDFVPVALKGCWAL